MARQSVAKGTAAYPPGGSSDAAGRVLRVAGVRKTFRSGMWPRRRVVPVLRGADMSLDAGEIVGLVGENGSGKTTLMRIIAGGLRRDSGVVERHEHLGYCPQEPILYGRLTCDEHFELFSRAYAMDAGVAHQARDQIYDELGFGDWAGARAEELSGGTRAKLNLGLALLPDPDLLLLDEPYSGFDWETYQRFWGLARRRRDAGRAVLIVSHFVTDEERFDRIYQIRDGVTVER